MKNKILHIMIPGEPSGIKIIEVANWNGKAFVIPRANLTSIEGRPEADDPALYFLFGESDETTNQKLYIGESESFYDRLANHDANKDFWNFAVVFTGGLDKAKVRYLEYLANVEAVQVGRFDILNLAKRTENTLSEYDEISTKDYFEMVKFILTVLGYPVFDHVDESVSDKRIYHINGEGADARAQLLDDGSMVLINESLIRRRTTESFPASSRGQREEVLKSGGLKEYDEESYITTRELLFKTPSGAANFVVGRAANGWTGWKDEKGATLDENLRK